MQHFKPCITSVHEINIYGTFIIATSNFLLHLTKFTIWSIGLSMLELQQKYSELQTFENRSQNIYSKRLKKQIRRKINTNSTEYFFSFSNFKILHLLIKSFVIPTPNRVYGSLKKHFLKSN